MGIYIAAAITTALVLGLYGYVIAKMSARADWPVLIVAALVALPLQPLPSIWCGCRFMASLARALAPAPC